VRRPQALQAVRIARSPEGQELFAKTRDPLYYEAQALETKGDLESMRQALAIYTRLYQEDIAFRDVRTKMPDLQERVRQMASE